MTIRAIVDVLNQIPSFMFQRLLSVYIILSRNS